MTDEESRKAFESHVMTEFIPDNKPFILNIKNGVYTFPNMQVGWEDWQAAVEWATKRERERCVNWIKTYSINSDKAPDMLRMIRSGE